MMISVHGGYYFDNFGDVLLFKIFNRWIQEHGDWNQVYPMVPKDNRDRFKQHIPSALIGVKERNLWDGMLFAGGGHFGQPQIKEWKRKWNAHFIRQHFMLTEWCIRKKIPFALVGIGAGPIYNPILKKAAKRMLDHADIISVRDEESREFITQELGVEKTIMMAPDPALVLDKDSIPPASLQAVETILSAYPGKKFIGIHQTDSFLRHGPTAQKIRAGIIRSLNESSDVMPVLFTDYKQQFLRQSDWFANIIEKETKRACLLFPFSDLWELVALISKLSALVTPKLHVGIVAYALDVYSESFATDQKIPRFYRQIGRPGQCTMMTELTDEHIRVKINRAFQAAHGSESVVDERWHQLKEEAFVNKNLTHSFLDSVLHEKYSHARSVPLLFSSNGNGAPFSLLKKELN